MRLSWRPISSPWTDMLVVKLLIPLKDWLEAEQQLTRAI